MGNGADSLAPIPCGRDRDQPPEEGDPDGDPHKIYPVEIKNNAAILAAVERQRDAACRYLAQEGFLATKGTNSCASEAEWCIYTGVIHHTL